MTELSIWFVLALLGWDYVVDAWTQVGGLGSRKDEWKILLLHSAVYGFGLIPFLEASIRIGWASDLGPYVSWWPTVNTILHGAQDAITTRLSKRFFEDGNNYMGFNVVLGDQLLHHATLLLTWVWLV